jgi:hypothetical protein
MKRIVLALLAVSTAACVSLPRPVSMANRPTDALLLEGAWSGDFSSTDGQRGGGISFVLAVLNDTARGPVIFTPVAYLPAASGASAPMRAESRPAVRTLMNFVSVTDGVVTGVIPAFYDVDRGVIVQTTFVGRMRSWNVIEGSYVTLGTSLRVEEYGTWRVVRQ